ncbi:MAG: bifunctional diaminohydroxyphosphoribosylaminopyrimidine deaminase/5-amino-6-(5-phosphoribosylamino)uracil reductase RibD [Verrucomicrobiota bacterium JB023]|nr:bifunctional diaminohydroxyphosphoribosylaminopyrimidine deaminase/5-amino-6-(5-phosphoribosylamino)uracil reductase RibD [Verrucomicrobiota bacterium JB023]
MDEDWMRIAIAEGRLGVGLTAPNPPVGAVLVKGGKVIGKGWHRRAGQPHAEVEALRDAAANGQDPAGATAYVTLEPCSTVGRTPACTSGLTQAGVKRVVWSCEDPNPAHAGRAHEVLRAAGIETLSGVLEEEGKHLIRAFAMVQRVGRPWVMVKTAMSLDGRITRPPGEGQWLTGPEARAEVQVLRGEVDAILTSGRTARADNPQLTYRGERAEKKQPLRLVVSRREKAGLESSAYLLADEFAGLTRFLEGSLRDSLKELAVEGVQSILVEAGGELVGHLFDEGLVDEYVAYFAPMVCGGSDCGVGGRGAASLGDTVKLDRVEYARVGEDVRVRGLVRR